MEIIQWLEHQIATAAVTAALLALAGFLLRTAISERIRRAIGHEYDTKLEELRSSNVRVLEELRSARAERETFRAMAMSLMTSTRAGTLDKRIAAIDVLWTSLHELRAGMPYIIGVLDMVGWDTTKLGSQGLSTLEKSNSIEILAPCLKLSAKVAKCRPFLGDQLYSLYHASQAILGRAVTTTIISHQQHKFRYWFEEQDTVELLKTVLSIEELSRFKAMTCDKLDWLYRLLEGKIVLEIQRELSGEPAAEQALLQANRILERSAVVVQGVNRAA